MKPLLVDENTRGTVGKGDIFKTRILGHYAPQNSTAGGGGLTNELTNEPTKFTHCLLEGGGTN